MTEDLKIIKKLYGEKMMHFCRSSFPTILENEGLLPKLLRDNFYPSHELFEDLNSDNLLSKFKDYIYDMFHKTDEEKEQLELQTPKELMAIAGYKLYECKTEKEIQAFKKYYAKGEELCTFRGKRLDKCYVFFAVKDDAETLRREDFKNPKRQDKYGTSVISIQFSKDAAHTLSIKNRYNHIVANPDATFGNNLEQIIPGLTESFERVFGLAQKYKNSILEIPNYIRASDGKWYKYNYEIRNVYYCPNNIIIDNFEAQEFDKERFIIMDYFILDLERKAIYMYDNDLIESFPEYIADINKIQITKEGDNRNITIIHKNGGITKIVLDKDNRIIEFESEIIHKINNDFLTKNEVLSKLSLPNVVSIGSFFLMHNKNLETISVPSLVYVGLCFLFSNTSLKTLEALNLEYVGQCSLDNNDCLYRLITPKLRKIGASFLTFNTVLREYDFSSLDYFETDFLAHHPNRQNIISEISKQKESKRIL